MEEVELEEVDMEEDLLALEGLANETVILFIGNI